MGHPMAKKGNRKRGDKFIKPQNLLINRNQEQEKPNQPVVSAEEKYINDQYLIDMETK